MNALNLRNATVLYSTFIGSLGRHRTNTRIAKITLLALYCFCGVASCAIGSLVSRRVMVISTALSILTLIPFSKRLLVSFMRSLSRQDEEKIQKFVAFDGRSPLGEKSIEQMLHLSSNSKYRLDLLNEMSFRQLEMARQVLGTKAFASLMPQCTTPATVLWESVNRLSSLPSKEQLLAELKRLEGNREESWFISFMYALHRALQKTPYSKDIEGEMIRIAPFLKPVSWNGLTTSQGAILCLKFRNVEGEKDSFKRIFANLEGVPGARTAEEWLADLRTAHRYFNPKGVQAVEEAFCHCNAADATLAGLKPIVHTYTELGLNTELSERFKEEYNTRQADLRTILNGAPELKKVCEGQEYLDYDSYYDALERLISYGWLSVNFKAFYAYTCGRDDANARYTLNRLRDFYKVQPEDIKLKIYAYHEVPTTLLN